MTTTTDVEMSIDKQKKDIEILRKKLMDWSFFPYLYQLFNKEEPINWRNPMFIDYIARQSLQSFYRACKRFESFDFSIEPTIVGKVKHCSYSDLDGITNFKNPEVIQKTISGRLFQGTIVEGSEKRSVIVKTWDFHLPMRDALQCLTTFCDEIELFTDERVNMHPNLVKLYRYCCDTRLALVFDEEFTGLVLSDVLLSDDFGWVERMKVATQLADLYSCLHENNIALDRLIPANIKIDKEFNIKVFDFGFVTNTFNVDDSFLDGARAPEILKGERTRTMKSDVYYFGILLLELMAKRKFSFAHVCCCVQTSIATAVKRGKKYLVHECFTEVDYPTALAITLLVFLCTNFDPDKRPSMKDVIDTLNAMGMGGVKRKRDEYDAEQ
ncbi:probable receptor-like protein kinase At5g56460 isoform X2 [Solanum tuberosum]|uniref:probable receptor-like protein kinase At5g56460 isoform X2 n=1 Tax=Solanum tuberosum TaxID=4113 RepID=UPI0003D2511F|nr:PREDICTED: probable receptor-like protein kinase At5g56460 isoform X2 [Solanum tuberosum]